MIHAMLHGHKIWCKIFHVFRGLTVLKLMNNTRFQTLQKLDSFTGGLGLTFR